MKVRCTFTMLALLMISVLCYSQNNQYILSGQVVDKAGAALPGAGVSVTNDSAVTVMRASTDAEGYFSLQKYRKVIIMLR